jgi:aminoglycoside 6'-N-acetyltransferase I
MIRPVERSDASAWGAQRAKLWPEADANELAAEARAFVSGSAVVGLTAVFIAADEAATPLGFLELSVRAFADGCDSMPVPHIEGWYVEPHARGTGVGRRLIERAQAWSRTHGFTEIASDAQVQNEASIGAHTKCGFTEVERLVKFRKSLA